MRFPFLALGLVVLAGCQPIPHPFAYQAASPNLPALRPPDSVGISVLPVDAGGSSAGAPLADALARGLIAKDVPASVDGGNRGSFRLSSSVATAPEAEGRVRVTLDWRLADAAGKTVGSGSTESDATESAWQAGDAALATALAGDAVPKIVELVTGGAPLPGAVAATAALLSVQSVSGAPGDGNTSLARAIVLTLGRAGIAVSSGGDAAPLSLTCVVEIGPAQEGKQAVQIHWQVSKRGGPALGRADQQNAVPAGSLDGAWSDIAYAVAAAAAPGIADLVHKAEPLLADAAAHPPTPQPAPPQPAAAATADVPRPSPTVAVAAAPVGPVPVPPAGPVAALPAKPDVTASVPPSGEAQFLVQFGAFRDADSGAKSCAEAAKLAPAHLVRSAPGEPVWYRCRTDAPLSRADATALAAAASSAGASAILVPLAPH